jgi:hypothetical protein
VRAPERTGKVLYWCAVAVVSAVGLYLRREALRVGFMADDYAQLGMLDGRYPVARAPYNLFSFSDGSTQEGLRLMTAGFYPWWADLHVRISMLRPLASLMIYLDHRLFGSNPLPFHLHSVAWWFFMLGTVAAFFRRLLAPATALVAFTLFAFGGAHAHALTWICNRNAFVSIAFSILALDRYVAHRRSGRTRWPFAAMLLYAVAFGFGEYSMCLLAYLAAFESCEGTESPRARLRAVIPMLVPAFVFLGARTLLGATVQRSGVYVDPVAEPLEFLQAVLVRVPLFLGDLMFAVRSEFWTFGLPWLFAWAEFGIAPKSWLLDLGRWRHVQIGIGVGAGVLLLTLYRFALRGDEHRNVRWLCLGSLLSLIPVCASFPSSRLLLFALVGFAPLVATFVVKGVKELGQLRVRPFRALLAGSAGLVLLAFQTLIPLDLQHAELVTLLDRTSREREAILDMPVDEARFPGQDLVLLTALDGDTSMYVPLTRLRYGKVAPHSCMFLSYLIAPYDLERTAIDTFTMRFRNGDALLGSSVEQLLRSPKHPFHPSDVIETAEWRMTVLGTYKDKPQYMRIEFNRPLDDPSLLFMALTPDGYRVFYMPPIGGKVTIYPAMLPKKRNSASPRHSS